MSEYIKTLREHLEKMIVPMGYQVQRRTSKSLRVVKDSETIMTINDRGEVVEIVLKGKSYNYDKWYTSPERLATVITNFFSQQS
jgi:hypothetical protein